MPDCILIVDDDPVQRRLLSAAVSRAGHEVLTADRGQAALEIVDGPRRRDIAVIVLDLMMPGLDGSGVLKELRQRELAIPVIVQTAQGGIETVVRAMRAGAFDFVVKPVSPERLMTAVNNALKVEAVEHATRRNGATLTSRDIVTGSYAMQRAIRLAQKAAGSDIPILIEGESGVGKEVIARSIQQGSARRTRPFITVNCGAIPETLVESILFGHEKGSFTGATEKHAGKFVEAHGGTLFLDEIGDLPRDIQVKLLRAVQEGEVDPVGARAPVRVDIRLISATHRDLLQLVKDGRFREDLFYRLNVFPIFVPPLRDRMEDIPELVEHFMGRVGPPEARKRIGAISDDALAMLVAYDWPGNVRQLENAVFRAMVLCEGHTLTVDDFPQIRAQVEGIALVGYPVPRPAAPAIAAASAAALEAPRDGSRAPALSTQFGVLRALDERGNVRSLSEVEFEMIKLAIDHYEGQMSEVARRLGIGRSTLYRKLKEYGIDPEAPRADAVTP